MTYAVTYGNERSVEKCETALECLELTQELQVRQVHEITIIDPNGVEISLDELERRCKVEMGRGELR